MKNLNINSTIKLNNGNKMPFLGLGTWQAKGEDVENAVYYALKIGYRHIDTAKLYGNEVEVGKAIKKAMKDFKIKREELFITTKLWPTDFLNPIKAFDVSLEKLGLSYIDLYLIHWPMFGWKKVWKELQILLKEEKCKNLGVSNFTIKQLNEIIEDGLAIPTVNQVEFSIYSYKKDLLEFCKHNKIVLEAYSPLARARDFNNSLLTEMSKKYGKTPAQIMLRWSLQHDAPIIPKSINDNRVKENTLIFDFNLSGKDMKILDEISG